MGTAKNMDFPSYVLCCVPTIITMTGRLGADRGQQEKSHGNCAAQGGAAKAAAARHADSKKRQTSRLTI